MQPKFRAKLMHDHPTRNLKKGDWVFGFYLEDLQDGEWKSFIFCDCTRYEVDKETLGQFTGLLDVNNKDIYTGDCILTKTLVEYIVDYKKENAMFVIVNKNSINFGFGGVSQNWIYSQDVTLKGNKWDNILKAK